MLAWIAVAVAVVARPRCLNAADGTICVADGNERVALRVPQKDPLWPLVPAVLAHLQVELKEVGVCLSGDGDSNRRLVVMRSLDLLAADVEIVVADGTGIPRTRMLELRAVPVHARPLTLGIATMELLGAVATKPRARVPVPLVAAPAPATPEATARLHVALGFAAQSFMGGRGHAHAGPDVEVALGVTERSSINLHAAYLMAPDVHTSYGAGSVRAFVAGIGGTRVLTSSARSWGAAVLAETHMLRLAAVGHSVDVDASGRAGSAIAWVVDAGPRAWISLHPRLRMEMTLTAGIVLRSVALTDGEQVVAQASAFAGTGTLRLAAAF